MKNKYLLELPPAPKFKKKRNRTEKREYKNKKRIAYYSAKKKLNKVNEFASCIRRRNPKSEQWFVETCNKYNIPVKIFGTWNYVFLGYILDYYNKDYGIAIEIDDPSHDYKKEYDIKRDNFTKSRGATTFRIKAYSEKDFVEKMLEILNFYKKVSRSNNYNIYINNLKPGQMGLDQSSVVSGDTVGDSLHSHKR